jgi:hypothetical protein
LSRILGKSQGAGVLTLLILILLFPPSALTAPAFPLIILAAILCSGIGLWRRRGKPISEAVRLPAQFTFAANIVALGVSVAVGGQMVYGAIGTNAEADRLTAERVAALRQTLGAEAPRNLPHIVHIVLDGYSRADVLKSTYGFDNSAFIDALRRRGFHVASRSKTPFNQTVLVMSSIFAMGPITEEEEFRIPTADNATYRKGLMRLMQGSAVGETLDGLGYERISTPEAYVALQQGIPVRENGRRPMLGDLGFPTAYVLTHELLKGSPLLRSLNERLLRPFFNAANINYAYLKGVPHRRFEQGEKPLFIYQHILAPHPPFNITPTGAPRSLGVFAPILADNSTIIQSDENRRAAYRKGYLDKLQYINSAILLQIDALKESLDGPIIILLHGDHGGGLHVEQEDKEKTCSSERFSPLFAVYASDKRVLSEFGDDFNIINIYRAIFRATLKAQLPDLSAGSTFVSWGLDSAAPVSPEELVEACPPPESPNRIAAPAASVRETR